MKKVRTDCFFIEIPEDFINEKITCKILRRIDCENCSFYKKKEDIVNNVFYEESFKNKKDYLKEVERYKEKYNEDVENMK